MGEKRRSGRGEEERERERNERGERRGEGEMGYNYRSFQLTRFNSIVESHCDFNTSNRVTVQDSCLSVVSTFKMIVNPTCSFPLSYPLSSLPLYSKQREIPVIPRLACGLWPVQSKDDCRHTANVQ